MCGGQQITLSERDGLFKVCGVQAGWKGKGAHAERAQPSDRSAPSTACHQVLLMWLKYHVEKRQGLVGGR
jgi:hypothetical protein